MLDPVQYQDLWVFAPNEAGSFATITGIPLADTAAPYNEYIIRENMFQDYLDIFRGINTRANIVIRPHIPANWYYPHPFFNPDGSSKLETKPCIKYILIAEAPPKVQNRIIKYIYNTQLRGGAYITAPLKAFDINGVDQMNTIERLINLAQAGVLVLDLFPFAINYTTIRKNLNTAGITTSFFNDIGNQYSITNRVLKIIEEGLTCENFDDQTNSVFIAPPKISYHLANQVNAIIALGTIPLIFSIGENSGRFLPPHLLTAPNNHFYHNIIGGTTLGGVLIPINAETQFAIQVPRYICCGYSGAGTVPHAFFITNALSL